MSARTVKVTVELVLSVNDGDGGDPEEIATWDTEELSDVIQQEIDSLTFYVDGTLNEEDDVSVDFDVLESTVTVQDMITV